MAGLREKQSKLVTRRDQLVPILNLKRAAKEKAVTEEAELARVNKDLQDVNKKLASLEAQRLGIVQSYQNKPAVK